MTIDPFSEDDNNLAAEYVLGLLADDDLASAKTRLANEQQFQMAVANWETHFATFADDLAPETPSPDVKDKLLASLFPEPKPVSFLERLWVWRFASVFSFVLLAVLLFSNISDTVPANGPLYTAEISADAGAFRVIATVDKTTNELILTKTAGAAPAGRILQVWAHGPDAPAMSVGLWPDGDTARLSLPPVIASVEGVLTVGISEEPIGGSLTGSPSGRVFGTVDIPGVTAVF